MAMAPRVPTRARRDPSADMQDCTDDVAEYHRKHVVDEQHCQHHAEQAAEYSFQPPAVLGANEAAEHCKGVESKPQPPNWRRQLGV